MFLRYLSPPDYRLRHDILGLLREHAWRQKHAPLYDADLAVGSAFIAAHLKKTVDQVEDQIHVLVMRGHVAYYHGGADPKSSHVKNEGVQAFNDKTHLKEGRDDAFKTLSVYGALFSLVATIVSTTVAVIQSRESNRLEGRIRSLETRLQQEPQAGSEPTASNVELVRIHESVWGTCGACDTLPDN